jgi:[pyruvate, water dikinase]-phosphate phosphotransferase / [pyruvate, water dikinase] kinase
VGPGRRPGAYPPHGWSLRQNGRVPAAQDANPVELHVVSDATGETAARLVTALEAQFPDQPFVEVRHPRVEAVEDLARAVNKAKGRPAVIVYTLVKPEWRESMRQLCRRARVHYCDLLGHPIDSVRRVSGVAARMTPGRKAELNEAYFKRMEAIEFAVKFDDGIGARGLDEADIVLVGVSRTSKTPLSMYLGYLGYKTANVPIVKGIEPPADLFRVEPEKIVGLTIDADRLAEIREVRARQMGAGKRYSELLEIYDELEVAANVHRRLGCPVIDVSELAVEETAHRIIRIVEGRREDVAVG